MTPAADLHPHPGPPAPPASAARTGIRSATCLRYRIAGGAGRQVLSVPSTLGGQRIDEGHVLTWEVFPAFDERATSVVDGYRAAAVSIDVVTDDGRRLLDRIADEWDGTSAAAAARVDIDVADQWNERRVDLTPLAGARIAAVELVVDVPARTDEVGDEVGDELEGWIDGPRITVATAATSSPSRSEWVTTTRGTHSSPQRSRGLTQPVAGVPHGGIHLSPATDLSNPHWTYSWNAHGPGPLPALAGMLVTRSPSIWIGDRGALAVRVGLALDEAGRPVREPFDHADERARPHRYGVRTASGISIDAAATDHAAVIEIALPQAGHLSLESLGVPLSHAHVERMPHDGSLRIHAAATVPSPHEPDPLRGYYVLHISGGVIEATRTDDGVSISAQPGTGPLRVEIGASLISTEQAGHAHHTVTGRSVDEVAGIAEHRWNEVLGVVDAPEASDDDRGLLASDLSRMFLFPTRHDEDTPTGPRYPSPTERLDPDTVSATGRAVRDGRMLTNNGFWDTYRTVWPAYALLAPDRAGALLNGMLEHVRDGGWSPRWTAGTPLDAMVGTSLDVIAADLVEAGVPGIDLETAYAAALRNATTPSPDHRFGRKGMPEALSRGYVDARVGESVSWTLEGAISDAGAAVLARALARRLSSENARGDAPGSGPGGPTVASLRADARFLAHRALAYETLWDAESQFFRPRAADGTWADEPFDPRVWGGAHTETNAWTSRFSAAHDGGGLARLFGGPSGLRQALDAYFTEPETARADFAGSYGSVIHEMAEARDIRRGMWGLSNQPAHHVPWLYAYTDTPWRVDEIVSDALGRLFRGSRIGQGYPGDEDNGEMAAWHLFGAIGFAPFSPGSGQLLVTAPTLDRIRLRPLGGAELDVRVDRRHRNDRYIRGVRRNGSEWTSPTVTMGELHTGGSWHVTLGPEPAPWSAPLPGRAHFAPDGVERLRLRDCTRGVSVGGRPLDASDAAGAAALTVEPGAVVELVVDALPPAAEHPLLVIGLEEAGTHDFEVTTGVDAGPRIRVEAARWAWPGQVRPFEVPLPAGASRVRVHWLSAPARITLAQVLVVDDR